MRDKIAEEFKPAACALPNLAVNAHMSWKLRVTCTSPCAHKFFVILIYEKTYFMMNFRKLSQIFSDFLEEMWTEARVLNNTQKSANLNFFWAEKIFGKSKTKFSALQKIKHFLVDFEEDAIMSGCGGVRARIFVSAPWQQQITDILNRSTGT